MRVNWPARFFHRPSRALYDLVFPELAIKSAKYPFLEKPPFFETMACSPNTTRSDCIMGFGLLNDGRVRDIRFSSSWCPANAGSVCVGEHESGRNFPGKPPSTPAGGV